MKKSSISTKIKILGILFTLLMSSIVTTTIYLNNKNQKDAMIINIAGKQRMLTQNISKNIFYLYSNKTANQNELDESISEFIYNLSSLKGGNNLDKLKDSPNIKIDKQMLKVELLWTNFLKNIELFKELLLDESKKDELTNIVNNIYNSNSILLSEVDALVSLHTINSEQKINFLKNTQYFFALLIVLLILYSFLELKTMEKNALKFIEESKKIMDQDLEEPLKPLKIEAEGELIEASNMFNSFLNKINSAIIDSNSALEQSKNASYKLEELTSEFDEIINELQDKSDISKQLNRSEDIAIQTQEQLLHSNKRLMELKNELEKIMLFCKSK
ncbi:PilJ domain-containing protein [Aliarcobacter faecis]|uniref:type IV pili methyl-accepting chemotaxis transducer N-terminal domain-containing protein n=1 Tax=Aliarcobacter faecis TaxID=1564138 RepID=UPI00047AC7E8|nr:type IV pili methyl-accepting chemotaxis transducer N-terminal domain-containing protein [Aliarcobacter faecis]QKF74025.1 PilJ domain-containing protein [Aliarcobacter faecis]